MNVAFCNIVFIIYIQLRNSKTLNGHQIKQFES